MWFITVSVVFKDWDYLCSPGSLTFIWLKDFLSRWIVHRRSTDRLHSCLWFYDGLCLTSCQSSIDFFALQRSVCVIIATTMMRPIAVRLSQNMKTNSYNKYCLFPLKLTSPNVAKRSSSRLGGFPSTWLVGTPSTGKGRGCNNGWRSPGCPPCTFRVVVFVV